MRKFFVLMIVFAVLLSSMGAAVPETLVIDPAAENWSDCYLSFLEENYDIFSALWPNGIGGMGFLDLDLDGTPEMILLDQGASVSMGATLFDLVDGQVVCISSSQENASGAFGGGYFSPVHVEVSYFEAFRLSCTDEGWCFWVDSTNGTMETTWNEIVRFDRSDDVLTPVSICKRYLQFDAASGAAVEEDYSVSGVSASAEEYSQAEKVYQAGRDTGYEAKGVYVWENSAYTASKEGLLAMAQSALDNAVSIPSPLSLSAFAG